MIRPEPAVWFEIVAAREDALAVLESLAGSGCAEIEPLDGITARDRLAAVAPLLRDYTRLAQRYRPYWPPIEPPPAACEGAPSATLSRALTIMQAWAGEADVHVRLIEQAESELAGLERRAEPGDRELALAGRIRDTQSRIASIRADIAALNGKYALHRALDDVARACWCYQNLEDAGAIFSRVTGWTNDRQKLSSCLQSAASRALVHYPKAPEGLQAPMLLHNPGWIQPFEVFSRLVGMPGRYGTDPSGMLALVAPLMFGYMFGDVIQGLVLVVVGLVLQRRWPMLRLVVAGGFAAIAFGFAFGSAGSVHGVVPTLWLNPLEDPLPVLIVPLVFGALLLGVGLGLKGVEAYWRGTLKTWLGSDAGFLALYAGILIAFVHPAGIWIAVAGTLLYVLGYVRRERRAIAALGAAGELLQKSAEILINTVSFVRVGAFAMAHAGLSTAIVALGQATGNCVGEALVLILGNVMIIAIEAMVASIQTTRLVLLEFFTRFFETSGREFHPLPSPSSPPEERNNDTKT